MRRALELTPALEPPDRSAISGAVASSQRLVDVSLGIVLVAHSSSRMRNERAVMNV